MKTPLVELLDRTFEPAALEELLGCASGLVPPRVWERALRGPAHDFLARPGKAIRARLVVAGWELGGGGGAPPPELPLLVELLHAGSLIVDDIEDGSTERRGGPALHLRHGLPLALNTGNWMYFLPLALLARAGYPAEIELALHRAVVETLVRCHHGQALDLAVHVWDCSRAELPALVATAARLKTGSLAELSITLGALAAGAGHERRALLAGVGLALGVGLQRLDDVGGLLGERDPGKRHEDLRLGRLTWPWAVLAEGPTSDEEYAAWRDRARAVAAGADPAPLAADLLERVGPRARATARVALAAALGELARTVGDVRAVRNLAAVVDQLVRLHG